MRPVPAITILITMLLLNVTAFGQTPNGPGGVGSTNSTSPLVLWLDASTLTGPLGATTEWPDRSGWAHHFYKGGGATLMKDATGRKAFEFKASNSNYFESDFSSVLNPQQNYVVMFAGKVNSSAVEKTIFSSESSIGGSHGYSISFSDQDYFTYKTARGATGVTDPLASLTSGPVNAWTVGVARMLDLNLGQYNKRVWVNTAAPATNAQVRSVNVTNGARVGASSKGITATQFFDGQVGEIILLHFPSGFNYLETTLVAEYLSAKYNATFAPNDASATGGIRRDLYTMDDAINGDFDFDVAGIGYATDPPSGGVARFHTDSQGTGIVRISIVDQSTISNEGNEYLFWGKNSAPLLPTTTDVPTGVAVRLQAIWRVQETGRVIVGNAVKTVDVGKVNISFDLTGMGASVTASDLRLLIDKTGGGFANGTPGAVSVIAGAVDEGNRIYRFYNVDFNNGDRFTIGSVNNIQTPLPVTLSYFDVLKNDDSTVRIMWDAASQINNDYFTVERSPDAIVWTPIDHVDGGGTQLERIRYEISDPGPANGHNYYRIMQTDFNGSSHYSDVRHVFFEGLKPGITVTPNPFSTEFKIELKVMEDSSGPVTIRILTAAGQTVATFSEPQKSIIILGSDQLRNVAPGLYVIQVVTTNGVFSAKIVKQG